MFLSTPTTQRRGVYIYPKIKSVFPNSIPPFWHIILVLQCGFEGCRLTFVPTVNYKRLALSRTKMSHKHFSRRLQLWTAKRSWPQNVSMSPQKKADRLLNWSLSNWNRVLFFGSSKWATLQKDGVPKPQCLSLAWKEFYKSCAKCSLRLRNQNDLGMAFKTVSSMHLSSHFQIQRDEIVENPYLFTSAMSCCLRPTRTMKLKTFFFLSITYVETTSLPPSNETPFRVLTVQCIFGFWNFSFHQVVCEG